MNFILINTLNQLNGKIIFIDGEQITDGEYRSLVNEARYLETMRIWKIISGTLRQQAQRKMFEESQCWDDMVAGKMMLHSIGVIENIVKILK